MSEVTGSKQYKSVVIQDRPVKRRLINLGLVIFFAVGLAVSFWFGGQSLRLDFERLTLRYEQAMAQLAIQTAKYQDSSQKLANIQLGSEVDRQAVDDVRSVVREHKQTITELTEEIAFYKGLMSPTDRERGLSIRSWEVYPTNGPGRFGFKLVLQQLALKHTVLKGAVSVKLIGKAGGSDIAYDLEDLSVELESSDIKLRFKYFQTIEGELQLPEGFSVERVDVVARALAPKAVTVEKQYGWFVQNI